MAKVHDLDGQELGEIELSAQDARIAEAGAEVSIHFHTPRMLRTTLGVHNFAFSLKRTSDGKLVAVDPDVARRFIELQKQVAAMLPIAVPDEKDNNA